MTKENKELLFKDLCSRIPYGVKFATKYESHKNNIYELIAVNKHCETVETFGAIWWNIEDIKPYLRPMSSMTEEEAIEFVSLYGVEDFLKVNVTQECLEIIIDDGLSGTTIMKLLYEDIHLPVECFDFLNARHFDFRGLIEKGLALEAKEGMYNF